MEISRLFFFFFQLAKTNPVTDHTHMSFTISGAVIGGIVGTLIPIPVIGTAAGAAIGGAIGAGSGGIVVGAVGYTAKRVYDEKKKK